MFEKKVSEQTRRERERESKEPSFIIRGEVGGEGGSNVLQCNFNGSMKRAAKLEGEKREKR